MRADESRLQAESLKVGHLSGHFWGNGGTKGGGYAAEQQFVRKGVRFLTQNLTENLRSFSEKMRGDCVGFIGDCKYIFVDAWHSVPHG